MDKTALFATLATLFLVAGCSTTIVPTTPEQHPEKYALQVIQIEVPLPDTYKTQSSHSMVSEDIDNLLKNPKAVITEFPIAYAAVGEKGINDQTETISLPERYEPKIDTNGVTTVVYINKDVKIGQYVEMTLQKVEDNTATCDLWFFDTSLSGSFKYNVSPATETQEAVTASLPKLKKRQMKTKMSLVLGNWISMGGLINENTSDTDSGETKTVRTKIVMAIRILPPSNTP